MNSLARRAAITAGSLSAATAVAAAAAVELSSEGGGRLLAVGLALIGGGLTAAALARLTRDGLAPVDGIAARLSAVDEASLERRLATVDLPPELEGLAQQVNALLDRLDGAFERERRTTSNIAHELRTPIAELRGLTEVAIRFGDDAAFAAKAVQESYAIAVEMDRIATTLLRVARAQAGHLEIQSQLLEADEQLRAAVDSVHELAQRRGIEVRLRQVAAASVLADPDLLDLILVNLLTNAAQHAPDRDVVECDVLVSGGEVAFVIENTNVGLEPEDMAHLTETFWKKKDQARKDPVHTGLGLALVHQLADTCGFKLALELVSNRVRATIVIPDAG